MDVVIWSNEQQKVQIQSSEIVEIICEYRSIGGWVVEIVLKSKDRKSSEFGADKLEALLCWEKLSIQMKGK